MNYHAITLKETSPNHPFYYLLFSGYRRKELSEEERFIQKVFKEEDLALIRREIRKRMKDEKIEQDQTEAQLKQYLLEQLKKNLRKKGYRYIQDY